MTFSFKAFGDESLVQIKQKLEKIERDISDLQVVVFSKKNKESNKESIEDNNNQDVNSNITIFDMMGRQVSKLVSSHQTSGYKSVRWNATNDRGFPVNAGIYLYRIDAGQFRQTKKMVLLK